MDYNTDIKNYLELTETIKNLRKDLKDLVTKKKEYELKIKEWMVSNGQQQIKSDSGKIVLYTKKVSKGSFTKEAIKEKLSKKINDPVKTDQLTEHLCEKEFVMEEAIKVVKN
jgi:hypothetical protein